jgi:exodeoxyribonuclease VII large subunit
MAFTMTEQPQDLRTIRETNERLRSMIETKDDKFWLGGIVIKAPNQSNLGHIYFAIEDAGYLIECMLPKRLENKAAIIKHGAMIDVYGFLRVYERQAQVQILVEDIRPLQRELIEYDPNVLEQLQEWGLWPRQPMPLPKPPQHIALITSSNSEARYDFENNYKRARKTNPRIELFDVSLETHDAPHQIAKRIAEANEQQKADIIVIVRGGGILTTFNDIRVAKAICESDIPVITGIGHERNQTLADVVADLSVSTPTDAAYKLVGLEPEIKVQAIASSTSQFPSAKPLELSQPIKHVQEKITPSPQKDEKVEEQPTFVPQSKFTEAHIVKETSTKPISKVKETPETSFFQVNAIGIIGIIIGLSILVVFLYLIFQSL